MMFDFIAAIYDLIQDVRRYRENRKARRNHRNRTSGDTGNNPGGATGSTQAQGTSPGVGPMWFMPPQPGGAWAGTGVDENLLPVRKSPERLSAWKYAHIRLGDDGPTFSGVAFRIPYRAEDDAVCAKLIDPQQEAEEHDPPGLNCSCGFYGLKDLTGKGFSPQRTPFLLEAEFSGRVIVCEHGYRAGKIRVLSVRVLRCCKSSQEEPGAGPLGRPVCRGDGLVAFSTPDQPGVIFCGFHADKYGQPGLTLAQLADQLGTEVRWRTDVEAP